MTWILIFRINRLTLVLTIITHLNYTQLHNNGVLHFLCQIGKKINKKINTVFKKINFFLLLMLLDKHFTTNTGIKMWSLQYLENRLQTLQILLLTGFISLYIWLLERVDAETYSKSRPKEMENYLKQNICQRHWMLFNAFVF